MSSIVILIAFGEDGAIQAVEEAKRQKVLDETALTDIEQRTVSTWQEQTFFRAWG